MDKNAWLKALSFAVNTVITVLIVVGALSCLDFRIRSTALIICGILIVVKAVHRLLNRARSHA